MSNAGHMPSHPADQPHARLEIVSNPLLNSGAREMVGSMARRMGFSEEAAHQISLAIDEALCNVEHHGYDRRDDRPIWINIFAIGGLQRRAAESTNVDASPTIGMRIVIEDEARQVDPATIKSRPLEQIRPGGLGVHIIREVMDDVRYERRERVGMRLTMVKYKPGLGPTKNPAGELPGGSSSEGGTRGMTP
ncbi:MAG: ATP-binding protein [Phycisphaerales bacterium]|jgi:anti-sigma regulatory factor (Ser/Thr protein kinase)|nr:ATP-binding protein [Phycisphaerales bacterium]